MLVRGFWDFELADTAVRGWRGRSKEASGDILNERQGSDAIVVGDFPPGRLRLCWLLG